MPELLLAVSGGAISGWAITALLTSALIVVPVLYLLIVTAAEREGALDRRIREIERYEKLTRRAQAHAAGKDFFGVLGESRPE